MPWRKKILAVIAILLLFLCDYLYWTQEMSLAEKLPEEIKSSVKADLIYYDAFFTPSSKALTAEDEGLAEILKGLEKTAVTRRPKFSTMSQPFFYLYLYYPDGYTCMTIVENGAIAVTPDMRSDKRFFFDSGEELYQSLLTLTE